MFKIFQGDPADYQWWGSGSSGPGDVNGVFIAALLGWALAALLVAAASYFLEWNFLFEASGGVCVFCFACALACILVRIRSARITIG